MNALIKTEIVHLNNNVTHYSSAWDFILSGEQRCELLGGDKELCFSNLNNLVWEYTGATFLVLQS